MPDMLVKLYELPPIEPVIQQQAQQGIDIRRVLVAEKHFVAKWVRANFSEHWVSETEVAFAHQPPACFIAVHDGEVIGFACYDTTAKGFFGPTGVDEKQRGKGIGKALLLVCLHALWAEGYIYGIIGGAGPVDFYTKAVGATVIEDSQPGIFRWLLRDKTS